MEFSGRSTEPSDDAGSNQHLSSEDQAASRERHRQITKGGLPPEKLCER